MRWLQSSPPENIAWRPDAGEEGSAAWAGRTFFLSGHIRVPTHRIVRFLRNRCFPGGSEAEGGRRPPGRQIEARGRKTHTDEFRLLLARSSVTPSGLAQTFLFSYRRRSTLPCRKVPASQRSETRSIRAARRRLGTRVASPRSRLAFCVSDQCRRVDFSRLSPHVQIVLTRDWPTRSPTKQEQRRINSVSNDQLTPSFNFIYRRNKSVSIHKIIHEVRLDSKVLMMQNAARDHEGQETLGDPGRRKSAARRDSLVS